MKQITIKNEVYNLPESWKEINLKQFNSIQAIYGDENMIPPRKSVAILAVLLNSDSKTVGKIPKKEAENIDISFINKDFEKVLEKEVEIDGVKYVPKSDFKNLELAEYVDLDYYLNLGVMENIHNIAAVIVRPVINGEIEEYDNETLDARANIFKERMNIVQLMTIATFFLSSANGLLEPSQVSL